MSGRERDRGRAVGLAERDLEARAADLRLELGGGAAGDDATVVDDDDAVGELVGLVEVLGGEQQRDAVGDELADDLPHPHPAGRVEAGGRLVEEEHRWPGDEAGGEVEAPAHAAGVALEDAAGGVGEIEVLEQLASPATVPRARRSPLRRPIIMRFCRPVSSSSRVASWAVTPMLRCTAPASRDDVVAGDRAEPPSGIASVVRIRTAVVLPAPFGPSMPRIEPAGTSRSIPSSATVSPKRLVRPCGVDHRIVCHTLSLPVG